MDPENNQDITEIASLDSDDAIAEALLSKWSAEDGESPSDDDRKDKKDDAETDEEGEVSEDDSTDDDSDDETGHQEEEDDEGDADDESDEADETTTKVEALKDDAIVKVTVNGEELDVPVKDLKRLYGQEKALTQKSQEVSEQRKVADANVARLTAQYDRLYERAMKRFEPYANVDMLVASKVLDAEQFTAFRAEAQAAHDELQFVMQEAGAFLQAQQETEAQRFKTESVEAIKVLTQAIPDWSPKLYDDIRQYAIGKGLDADRVNRITDPGLIQMLHKARLYDEGKKVATTKKVAKPKKVLKATATTSIKDTKGDTSGKAMKRLQASGSTDDAAALLLSRWASEE